MIADCVASKALGRPVRVWIPLQESAGNSFALCQGPQLVEKMFASFANRAEAAEIVRGVLEKYLSNERPLLGPDS